MTTNKTTVKDTLLQLMALAGIPEALYDSTTVAQLALRLDARGKLPAHARCTECGRVYTLQGYLYLDPVGYYGRDGERCECGAQLAAAAPEGAKTAVPFYENG